jgi:hypothetical protein
VLEAHLVEETETIFSAAERERLKEEIRALFYDEIGEVV